MQPPIEHFNYVHGNCICFHHSGLTDYRGNMLLSMKINYYCFWRWWLSFVAVLLLILSYCILWFGGLCRWGWSLCRCRHRATALSALLAWNISNYYFGATILLSSKLKRQALWLSSNIYTWSRLKTALHRWFSDKLIWVQKHIWNKIEYTCISTTLCHWIAYLSLTFLPRLLQSRQQAPLDCYSVILLRFPLVLCLHLRFVRPLLRLHRPRWCQE